MPTYKIKHTSIMHNKKVYGEGSEIELTDVQAARLADFVELVPNQEPQKNKSQTAKTPVKTKSEGKTKTETEAVKEDGESSETGAKDGE